MQSKPVDGALYATQDDDGRFSVIKVLRVDDGGVHIRQYSNSFHTPPVVLDSSTLFMAGLHREPGIKLGLGHTPVSHETFATWKLIFLKFEPTTPDELDGYEYWKEEGGGYF